MKKRIALALLGALLVMASVPTVAYAQEESTESTENTNTLTKSSKSPASIAKSNKQWVGTCLYQKGYKPLLINCKAVIWL